VDLTGEQRRVLAAAVDRILPSDDGPGAAETEAAVYVERLLETNPFRSWQPLFDDGLDRFEELAAELYGRPFTEISPEERDEVLRRFQAEPDRLRQTFFRKLVSFTLEAFLRDPAHLGWSYLDAPEARAEHCLGPSPGKPLP
jgi:gluconate 2-dehydrogenase gamma chain